MSCAAQARQVYDTGERAELSSRFASTLGARSNSRTPMSMESENIRVPTIRKILAGYRAVNEREREEARERLPRLTVEESVRQYLRMRAFVHRVAPDAERTFLDQFAQALDQPEIATRYQELRAAIEA